MFPLIPPRELREREREMRILAVKKKEKPFPPLGVFPFSSFFSLEFHLSLSLYFYNDAPRPLPQAGAQQQQPRLLPPGARENARRMKRRRRRQGGRTISPLSSAPIEATGTIIQAFPPSIRSHLPYPFIRQSARLTNTAGVSRTAIDLRRGSRGRPQGRGEVLVLVIEFFVAFVFARTSRREHRPRRVRRPRRGGPGPGLARGTRVRRLRRRR